VCPTGWHIPNSYDWSDLFFHLATNGYNYDGSIASGNNWIENKMKTLKERRQTNRRKSALSICPGVFEFKHLFKV
jgi:uncharacterized protein (TIGR02145 family)